MCRAFTIQYVYDVSSGQCIEMTYGGCGASENSFTTLQECQQTCEKPCNKPQVAGPCRANLPHYYFDRGTLSCQLFDYGGCEGNGNNFETSEECEAHCGGIRDRILSLDPSRGKAFKDSVTKCGTGGGSKDGCTEDVHSNSKGTDGETKDVDVKSGDSDSKSEDSDSKSKDNDNKSGDSDSKSDDSDSKSEDSDGKSEDSDSKSGDSDSKSEDSDSKSKDNDSKSGDSDSKSDDSDSKSEDNDSKSSEDKDGNGKDRGGDIKNGDLAGNGGAKNGNREQETTQTPETTQVPTARGQPNQPGNNGEEPDVAFGNLMKYRPKKLFDSFNFAAHILFRPNKKPKQNKH
ncbi:clumping factor A [Aplysia californica]|uniref:Clumping factor A n=1 Tax=Aplysia californica TaxID=6500 RepID=A0ABM0JRG9_APLCA|nr:clumping factor A [Aplysia californica]